MTAPHIVHRLFLASAALAFFLPGAAFSQDTTPTKPRVLPDKVQPRPQVRRPEVDPNVTVRRRPRPEYDPLGIRVGSFLVLPEISLKESYTDNAALDENDEQTDFVTQIQPSVQINSDWSRHALGLELGSDIAIHADQSDEDYEDFFALGNGRLDVSRQTSVTGTAELRQAHEGRDDPEDADNQKLTDFYRWGAGLALNHQFNRIGVTVGGKAERNDFNDAADDDRDATIYDFLVRTSYDLSPRLDLFVEGRYNVEDRDENVDDAGIKRDTDGYEARFGASVDVTSVLFGEAFVGYRVQQFDDNDFDDETGLSFGLDMNWNPTLLTTVGFSGQRDFRPTNQAGAASNFRTQFGVTVDHELLRNMIIGAEATYLNDNFRGDDREDDTYLLGLNLTYWLNRNLSIGGGYDYSKRNSNQAGQDFEANTVSIGLTARL